MLIPSKLSRPVRLQNTVIRDRLLAKLASAGNYRLTLVNCPAGYGKTTLIAQWAAGKADLGWYSLDESDNQPERFASYLIAALQQASGGRCVKSEALSQKHQYASLSALFAQLFIELADWHQPLYLVIDDYHLITNDAIHEAMRFFLRHQPENLTLILLSRTLPPLGIANLRVRDQLLEMGTQQLAFTHQEAKQFFDCRLAAPMEQQDSSRLCDEVEGWATALQLIALSARQSASSAQLSAKRLAGLNASHLSDYLVDEVLDHVDAEARAFLLRCSVLRSMNDALIERLTGEDNGQQRLEELEPRGCLSIAWTTPANGSTSIRCSLLSCASVASGSWRWSCRGCTAPPPRAGWRWGIRRRPFTMRWRPATSACCAISCCNTPGRCSTTANWPCWRSASTRCPMSA